MYAQKQDIRSSSVPVSSSFLRTSLATSKKSFTYDWSYLRTVSLTAYLNQLWWDSACAARAARCTLHPLLLLRAFTLRCLDAFTLQCGSCIARCLRRALFPHTYVHARSASSTASRAACAARFFFCSVLQAAARSLFRARSVACFFAAAALSAATFAGARARFHSVRIHRTVRGMCGHL